MRILVTGANGFIGKNLCLRLKELGYDDVAPLVRETAPEERRHALERADFVFHLAGVNRPQSPDEFQTGNAGLTAEICEILSAGGRAVPLVLTSSTQALSGNDYGRSKLAAEESVLAYGAQTKSRVHVARLTNVFGKWARPNYNSGVATFCHNISRGLPITVNNENAPLSLVHIDDVVSALTGLLKEGAAESGFLDVGPVYDTTVGAVVSMLRSFAQSRDTMIIPPVGSGFVRALYSTFLSYMEPDRFTYNVPRHADPRGVFVEMLKTPDCGQFSYFTAPPGITRGEHYHHTKTEKFLVIQGTARFEFRQIMTGERCEITARGGEAKIVETIPGWVHNITNVGANEMIVMLWANEIFDRDKPDTVAMKVAP